MEGKGQTPKIILRNPENLKYGHRNYCIFFCFNICLFSYLVIGRERGGGAGKYHSMHMMGKGQLWELALPTHHVRLDGKHLNPLS